MHTRVIFRAYGRPATEALAEVVDEAKQGRALAPVTVVVPSNFAGLAARRVLGSGRLGLNGIANVNFFTPLRLAELLSVGRLRDQRPLTNPVLGAAVRRALATDPHHFRNVRDHQATEEAIAAVVGELGNVGARGLEAIEAGGGDAGGVISLYRAVKEHLRGFHDEADMARAAAHRSDLAGVLAPYGHVVWYLPGPTTAPLATMMRSVLEVADSTVIVGRSGDVAADREVVRTLRIAGITDAVDVIDDSQGADVNGSASEDRSPRPLADHVISVTDADEEVRAVIREIVQLVDGGVALDRIGVFHPAPDPYVRVLEQQLSAAGIPANGPSRRRLGESIAGRVLLGALALTGDRWRRDRVLAVISGGPLRHGGDAARPSAWETLSRDAGIIGGLGDWRAKLARYAERTERQTDDARAFGHDGLVGRLERQRADVDRLAAFFEHLVELVSSVEQARSWRDRCEHATRLVHELLGPAHTHPSWPEHELAAFEQVEAALDRLALLDEIDPDPTSAVFRRALEAELSVARRRNGRFGHGVVYGPVSSAPGQDFDAVFVLGCTEGLCPTPRREDVLLPDAARRLTDGDLPERLGQIDEQHRLFLAALATAPAGRRWLFFPRGDLRSSRRSRPSRWLLPSASTLAGRTLYSTDFEDSTPAGVHEVPSHAEALLGASHHASVHERDLAAVYSYLCDSGDPAMHPATQVVARGLQMQRARRGTDFTEFDGNLGSVSSRASNPRPLSASRLESWASCGFRYYLGYELGLAERDDPERTVELSPLDRGTALHLVLERFFREMSTLGPVDPATPWAPEHRQRAHDIASEVFADLERRGLTGRSVTWATQRRDLDALIDEFLVKDDEFRAATGAVPTYFELPFGIEDRPPVDIEVDGADPIRFRGFIDRVDVTADGRVFVSDYKTGHGRQYKDLESGDPTMAGTMLQLGLYAEAAAQHLGADTVDTRYWMVNTTANHARYGYPWTSERRERLVEVLSTTVEGIEGGVFAAAPGEWQSFRMTYENCTYCDFDDVCPTDRAEQAAEKRHHPALEVRVALTESKVGVA